MIGAFDWSSEKVTGCTHETTDEKNLCLDTTCFTLACTTNECSFTTVSQFPYQCVTWFKDVFSNEVACFVCPCGPVFVDGTRMTAGHSVRARRLHFPAVSKIVG